MNKRYHFFCPSCEYDHEEHGELLNEGVNSCPQCLQSGIDTTLTLFLPKEQIDHELIQARTLLQNKIDTLSLTIAQSQEIKALLTSCLNAQVQTCIESLRHCLLYTSPSPRDS